MPKTKERNEVEWYKGRIREMRLEIRRLKQRIKELEKKRHLNKQKAKEEELSNSANLCKVCGKAEMEEHNFTHVVIMICPLCNNRERIK